MELTKEELVYIKDWFETADRYELLSEEDIKIYRRIKNEIKRMN